jgi:hypothetical protein
LLMVDGGADALFGIHGVYRLICWEDWLLGAELMG